MGIATSVPYSDKNIKQLNSAKNIKQLNSAKNIKQLNSAKNWWYPPPIYVYFSVFQPLPTISIPQSTKSKKKWPLPPLLLALQLGRGEYVP